MGSNVVGLGVVLLSVVLGAVSATNFQTVSALLDKLLENYHSDVRPGLGREPLLIETDVLIKSMGTVSEVDMSYSMQVYFRQRWHDDRLRFRLENVTEFTLNNLFLRHIWKPNTYFLNGLQSKSHNVTVPNVFVRIREDGRLYMSRRLTVNAHCPMKLHRYPMDKPVCSLIIGSFGYTVDDVQYMWKPNVTPVDIDEYVTMSQFELGDIHANSTFKTTRYGNYSILQVYIHLHRNIGFNILQTYLPCCLIVLLSWLSFWINRDAAPARVLLGVTTILSLAAIGMTVREGLPRVPYATALDVFMNVCLLYNMAALIEYAAVNYFTKILPKEGGQDEEEEEEVEGPPPAKLLLEGGGSARERQTLLEGGQGQEVEARYTDSDHCCYKFWRCFSGNFEYRIRRGLTANMDAGNSVSSIDMVSRVAFPATFIVFNIAYWKLYLYS